MAKVTKEAEQEIGEGAQSAARISRVEQDTKSTDPRVKAKEVIASIEAWAGKDHKEIIKDKKVLASIKAWAGEDHKLIISDRGDFIFMSKNGLIKFRTDFYSRKYPPHFQLEVLTKHGN
ncbi:MAG: hypothetical protein ACX93T_01925 [Bacteroidota bacterium]